MQNGFSRSRVSVQHTTLRENAMKKRSVTPPASKKFLTPREVEVLTLVAQGNAYAYIAHRLSISEDTAKVHIEKARRKLGAKNRTHAAVIAVMNELVKF